MPVSSKTLLADTGSDVKAKCLFPKASNSIDCFLGKSLLRKSSYITSSLFSIPYPRNDSGYGRMAQAEAECELSQRKSRASDGFDPGDAADGLLKKLSAKNASAPIATVKMCVFNPFFG
jgi:hypothetical protein